MVMLSGEQFTMSFGDQTATVVAVGGGLRAYRVGDRPVTETWPEDILAPRGCGAVLVPWPNRLRGGRYEFGGRALQLALTEPAAGNAIHGLGRWARWQQVAGDDASVTIGLDVVPQTGYPFEVHVEVAYSLGADGLAVEVVATNTGTGAAPFGAGFHPYLHLAGHGLPDVVLRVPASRHLLVDDAKIPVGDEPVVGTSYDFREPRTLGDQRLDDAFTGLLAHDGRTTVSVRTPSGGADVWMDERFGWTQVFTLPDFTAGVAAIAVEPMSCPADAFNSGAGLVGLDPGATWSGRWGISPVSS